MSDEGYSMDKVIENLKNQIESLRSDAYFYDMQILFITNLQKTSPEVESEMCGCTFESIIEEDRIKKEKILQKISVLDFRLRSLQNEKAS